MAARTATLMTRTTAFSQWEQAIRAVCGTLSADPLCDVPFEGQLTVQPLGQFAFVKHDATVRRVHWSRAQSASAKDGYCFLVVQLEGQSRFDHNNHCHTLNAGDCMLVDAFIPTEFETSHRMNQLVAHIPRPLITSRIANYQSFFGRSISGKTGAGAILSQFTRSLYDQAGALSANSRIYCDNLLDLIAASGFPEFEAAETPEILQDIFLFMEQNLGDPMLTPQVIADRHGISVRRLHRLFHRQGQTVSGWLMQRRLAKAHYQLADRRASQRSILDIALDCGFNDASHFSRSFRNMFGLSPREHRRSSLDRLNSLC